MRARLMLTASLLGLAATAHAGVLYGFTRITSNAPAGQNVAGQLWMTVSDGGAGLVGLKFQNLTGISSSVKDIFFDFDDGAAPLMQLSAPAPILTATSGSSAVSFSGAVSSATFPGGNGAPYFFETDYRAASDNPAPQRGLNEAADSLTITFGLHAGRSYADVLSALNSGILRVGMHVIGIGPYSDGFINNSPPPIPAPAAAMLGALGLASLGLPRRRSRRPR